MQEIPVQVEKVVEFYEYFSFFSFWFFIYIFLFSKIWS